MNAALRPAKSETRPESSACDIRRTAPSPKLDRHATRLIAFGGRIVDDQPEIAGRLANPGAVADTLMRADEFNLRQITIGPVASRSIDGRLGVGIDREGIAGRINDFHF